MKSWSEFIRTGAGSSARRLAVRLIGTQFLEISDSKQSRPTLVDEVQVDPVSGDVLHVTFKEVDLKQKIEAEVPIEVVGEFDVKEAVMVQVRNSIVVEALPVDLPEKFVDYLEYSSELPAL